MWAKRVTCDLSVKSVKQVVAVSILVLVVVLAGCSFSKVPPKSPEDVYQAEDVVPNPTYIPISEYVDLSDDFSDADKPIFVDQEKEELACSKQNGDGYVQSDDCISVLGGKNKMIIHCTWNPQHKVVYIGLKNTETGIFYILPSVGGAADGTISLANVPDGEYHVVMCSNDNPSVVAVLLYQIL